MPQTPRFGLRFLGIGDSARNLRADLQANAETTETALANIQGFVASYVAATGVGQGWSQTFIARDTDGVPYFDPTGSVAQPVRIGLDIDGIPFIIDWSVT